MKIRKIFQFTLWGLCLPLLQSCSSCGLKAECEKTNWYQRGFDIAQKGDRPASDQLTQDCRKNDYEIKEDQLDVGFKAGMAHYCLPDTVYNTGKKGQFFNKEFCDPADLKNLFKRHAEGVVEFCTPESAYSFAAQGGVYNKICQGEAEKKFLPSYKQGRKKYLAGLISEKEDRIQNLTREVYALESERSSVQSELSSVSYSLSRERSQNAGNPGYNPSSSPLENRRSRLENTVSNLGYSISQKRSSQNALQEEIYTLKRELQSLQDQ